MYTFNVYIPNTPLNIHRHFIFTELYAANAFEAKLKEWNLGYTRADISPDFLTHAIATVQKELDLAAKGRAV